MKTLIMTTKKLIINLLGCSLFLAMLALHPAVQAGTNQTTAQKTDIWPMIPFVRGADLCKFTDAYGQTRQQYMSKMIEHAKALMTVGAYGPEVLDLVNAFDSLYDQNQALAIRNQYLDVTLESTLKSYLDQLYRKLSPREKRLNFSSSGDTLSIMNAAKLGLRDGSIDTSAIKKIKFFAYGTYALAPSCQGEVQVTLHLLGRNGVTESYIATGRPELVMSQIAADLFSRYQRTKFPSTVRVGTKTLTLVGGFNGGVDRVRDLNMAEAACATLEARLPTQTELEILDLYGDWSGGVSLNDQVWARPNGKVYAPYLRNPTPIREPWEVNATEYLYYCVK